MTADNTKRRLGRGLSALLADIDVPDDSAEAVAQKGVTRLPIEKLTPNPANPRRLFDDKPLDELSQSIRSHGIMQPLLVRPVDDGYEIIAGERRWRAAQKAGLHDVPVLVRDVTPSEALELALIENVQRADLNAIEEAEGYTRLIAEFGHKQDDLAKLIGKSRSHVTNMIRLLNLPDEVREHVVEGRISAGHARALLSASNPRLMALEVIHDSLSVRATEARVAKEREPRPAPKPRLPKVKPVDDANTRALVRRLTARLGLTVTLDHYDDESGRLTIHYSSLDQLDALCRTLEESD
ncbi:MAG: ParB/RepB/Spo0J family partition protein [Devosia sp.]